MDRNIRNTIRAEALKFFRESAKLKDFIEHVSIVFESAIGQFKDNDVHHLVQAMIVTGKLSYTPGLAIMVTRKKAG